MADVPGGASGLLVRRDYKAKRADRLVTRIASGVVWLVAEPRGHGSSEQWIPIGNVTIPANLS
jgi:hypothetical protein